MRLILLLILCAVGFNAVSAPEKRALIIAIGRYDKKSKWRPLSSRKDMQIVREALIQYLQFPVDNIDTLVDADATRKGIYDALTKLASEVKEGDMVVIHYSGHGTQMSDDNGDEMDGLDEALVPYDAPEKTALSFGKYSGYKSGKVVYNGDLHMRDDEFGSLVNLIRQKAGSKGHVVVIMDSCHSGTATRGNGTGNVRGASDPLILPNASKPASAKEDKDAGFGLASENAEADPAKLAKFVLMTGASANESNYEYDEESVGSLSYAFVKSISRLKTGETYASIFNSIRVTMASVLQRDQTPTLEGDVNLGLFTGEYHVPDPYYDLLGRVVTGDTEERKIMNDSVNTIRINAGTMGGVFANSKVLLMDAQALKPDPSGSLGSGTVVHAGDFFCDVRLDKTIFLSNKNTAHAFITTYAISSSQVTVSLSNVKDKGLKDDLGKALASMGLISIQDNNAKIEIRDLSEPKGGVIKRKIAIVNPVYGSTLQEFPSEPRADAVIKCKSVLMNFAQSQLLKELNLTDDKIRITIDLIPIDSVSGKELNKEKFMKGNYLEIEPGKKNLAMVITNQGTEPAYFNILDIQPDGKIRVLVPNRSESDDPSGWLIKPGTPVRRVLKSISPPYGIEIFKVVASKQKIDLRKIVADPYTKTRGSSNAFETLFRDSYQENFTRGDASVPEEVNTFEVAFKIIPKKSQSSK